VTRQYLPMAPTLVRAPFSRREGGVAMERLILLVLSLRAGRAERVLDGASAAGQRSGAMVKVIGAADAAARWSRR
jgi:hypothetical protein